MMDLNDRNAGTTMVAPEKWDGKYMLDRRQRGRLGVDCFSDGHDDDGSDDETCMLRRGNITPIGVSQADLVDSFFTLRGYSSLFERSPGLRAQFGYNGTHLVSQRGEG